MNPVYLLAALGVLIGALFLWTYLSTPKDTRWYLELYGKRINGLAAVIGERLTPAFQEATAAVAGLTALFPEGWDE